MVVVEVTETSSRIMDPELITKRIKALKLEKKQIKMALKDLKKLLKE